MSILAAQAQRLAEDGLTEQEIEAHLVSEGHAPALVRATVAGLPEWMMRGNEAGEAPDGGGSGLSGGVDFALGALLLSGGILGSMMGTKIFIGAIFVGGYRVLRGMASLSEG
jgi:hypothetical protein